MAALGNLQNAIKIWRAAQPVFDGEPPLDAPGAIEARIDEVLVLGQVIAETTPTEGDNRILDGINRAWVNPDVKIIVAAAIRYAIDNLGDDDDDTIRLPVMDPQALSVAGIDLETIGEIVTLFVAAYKWFREWRKKPAA